MNEDIFYTNKRTELQDLSEAWYHGYKVGKNTGYVEGRKAHHAHQWNKLIVIVFTAALIGTSLALLLFR